MQAQIAMPDPRQMSGIPRPVDDLPDGSVSVRLIKGELSNNIANHPVELRIGDKVQTVNTDEAGRAQFDNLPAGATLKAAAVVDGERLESQEFPAPSGGGIRLLLVATDKEKEAQRQAEASAPAVSGSVIIGGNSRILIEHDGDEAVRVYYLLEVNNNTTSPVNPTAPFAFNAPSSVTLLQGSSQLVTVTGPRVAVTAPFPPGRTLIEAAYVVSAKGGSVDISQTFPATLEHVAVLVKKVGDARLSSPQIARQQEMPANGGVYIAAAGDDAIPAGQPVVLSVTGFPRANPAPRYVALSLAAGILIAGVWAMSRPSQQTDVGTERKRLIARREKLFQDLVKLETERRRGKGDLSRYAARREELIASLEHVYGALDSDDIAPEPTGGAGVAA
jgi:hemin uptake protein HemP